MAAVTFNAVIWEGSDPTLLSCVQIDRSNTLDGVHQADISTLTYQVYDSTGTQLTSGPVTITISSAIYDTYQTGTIWTAGGPGFNFKLPLSHTVFRTSGVDRADVYTVIVEYTLTGGATFSDVFKISTIRQPRFTA